MSTKLEKALGLIEQAAAHVFGSDPKVRSVGVGKTTGGYGFIAIRNEKAILPLAAGQAAAPSSAFEGIPIEYVSSQNDPMCMVRLPHSGPGSPGASSVVPEQLFNTPLVCGLQLQNFDDDIRKGVINGGHMIVGTLGCFVEYQGKVAILSNNHVLAGENSGKKSTDRILHPGGPTFDPNRQVATLTDFVLLQPSPVAATVAAGTAILNDVDAAIALVTPNYSTQAQQSYLPTRLPPAPGGVAAPNGVAAAAVGDVVYKVGRTTGLTWGTIKQIGAVVGPVGYTPGPCWFRNNIIIEGNNGTLFSDHGDSGSAILRNDGAVVGLLYAGNGTQTYACDINLVLAALQCKLV
ncbi:hypothetical protein [Duganella sp. Root1480D1]|uniref:hypothetical protein n=1 Tax=Duganella sp. Root1480D1 TaxID=1736471 RepID=UPI0007145A41|nr:hypothetical protein [Duganella sp. Root1480D1]KQZ41469.1 hypothetical protein ASD58_26225 [Duganella sp. Root1480D1]